MAYTGHGHQIPNSSTAGSIKDVPKNPAQCGGVRVCPKCMKEVEDYEALVIGEDRDYPAKAKQMVKDYVDSLYKQNHPEQPLPAYEVYVESFVKVLHNWKARLGTTMRDGLMFEITFDGNLKMSYFDVYKKQDNFSIHDRG